jgi:hypothetical protein
MIPLQRVHASRKCAVLFALSWLACAANVATAQAMGEADMTLARTALGITTYDELATRCTQGKGFAPAERKQVDEWQSANSVPLLREHVRSGALKPEMRKHVNDAAATVIKQVTQNLSPCAAAVTLTRTPDAQFAKNASTLIASLKSGVSEIAQNTVSTPASEPRPPSMASPSPSGNASDLAAQIEGFGFDMCTGFGYGGMVTFNACPVVLFRNGDALEEIKGLSYPQGLAAHKAAKAKDWTRWKRSGDKVLLQKKDGWKPLTYTAVYPTLPKDFRLDGLFRALGGSGNLAMGGGQAVAAWTDYRFSADGRVERGGGAGASSQGPGGSVVTSSKRVGKSGRYRIDGLTLIITYDDGSSERRILIADPKDNGKGTIWLDGNGYVRKK